MYCKSKSGKYKQRKNRVLIVAKCIVNEFGFVKGNVYYGGINSSKVYCKLLSLNHFWESRWVLIVAKCIVNEIYWLIELFVLFGINSSKVYCKCICSTYKGTLISKY